VIVGWSSKSSFLRLLFVCFGTAATPLDETIRSGGKEPTYVSVLIRDQLNVVVDVTAIV
jgi:hypothetical protein